MTPDPVNLLLRDLAAAFPRQAKDVTRDTLLLYKRELSDLPIEAVDAAVKSLLRSSEFFPTIRAIREAAGERILGLPSESAALAQVEQRVRWRREDEDDVAPVVHDLVHQAVHLVGGYYTFRTTDNPSVIRGQFTKLYRDMRASAIRDIQVGTLMLESGGDRTPVYRDTP